MRDEAADCAVQTVNRMSAEHVCSLRCTGTTTILQIKHQAMAVEGTLPGRQSRFGQSSNLPLAADAVVGDIVATKDSQPAKEVWLSLLRHAWRADKSGAWITTNIAANGELLRAAERGSANHVEERLRLLICPNVQNRSGDTPLPLSSQGGHLEVARWLLEAGADKDKAAHDGRTALAAASSNGHLEVVQVLLEAGADKDKAKHNDVTALYVASRNGHLEVAQVLLEAGADKDKVAHDGWTALTVASQNGHLEVVRVLLEAGADNDKELRFGETALFVASEVGHAEVVRVLLEAGADKDKAAHEGFTALRNDCLSEWTLGGGLAAISKVPTADWAISSSRKSPMGLRPSRRCQLHAGLPHGRGNP